jgi:hypothetical protein
LTLQPPFYKFLVSLRLVRKPKVKKKRAFGNPKAAPERKMKFVFGFVTFPELSGICFLVILDSEVEKATKKHTFWVRATRVGWVEKLFISRLPSEILPIQKQRRKEK